MTKMLTRSTLTLALCLLAFGARRSQAAAPSAGAMDYFYQAYTRIQSLERGPVAATGGIPSFGSVQSALDGSLFGDSLYNNPGTSFSLTYSVYDLAVAEYEKKVAAYNQAINAANAIQDANLAVMGQWEAELTTEAIAAYATLSSYDSQWAQMCCDIQNVGIPSFAVNIILDTDFLRGVNWYQIPPMGPLQPLPPVPNPPSFPFILANYLTSFHSNPSLQRELDQYNTKKMLGPGPAVMFPVIGDTIADDYQNLPPSFKVPSPVTQDQLDQYQKSLNSSPTYAYPPMPSGPDFGSLNANSNLSSPQPAQASPASSPSVAPTAPTTPTSPPSVQPPSNPPSEPPPTTPPPHPLS